ncbi:MAG: PD-(D/E)XK nuclease family protein [Burkholderiales bacterium]
MTTQSVNALSPDVWGDIANSIGTWCNSQAIPLRDVCVLVPLSAHLSLARTAFAQATSMGQWVPRIDTPQTLALSLAPPPICMPGQISFDVARDRLLAEELLAPHLARTAWAGRDAPGRALMVAQVTELAHQLARTAQALPPAQRESFWANARSRLMEGSAAGTPGHSERLLAQVALAWAALAPAAQTDALFLHRPAAWVLVEAGGTDAFFSALALHAEEVGVSVLRLQTDAAFSDVSTWPQTLAAQGHVVSEAVGLDFEDEAQRAAAQVLAHVNAGEVPVALLAQDRLLVRRVRALLAREPLAVLDETGWTFSTTRAAALVAAALRLAQPGVGADEVLDALTSIVTPLGQTGRWSPQAVQELEFTWRKQGWRAPQAVDAARLTAVAATLWREVQAAMQALQVEKQRTLSEWLAALQDHLVHLGLLAALQNDAAGRQVLQRLFGVQAGADGYTKRLHFSAFSRWLDDVFEQASFIPPAVSHPLVVITPLSRTLLRPFAAVVFPGTDERQLGAWPAPPPLLGSHLTELIGLPTAQEQRQGQWLQFLHLLRAPRLTLLRRASDQEELLAASPFVLTLATLVPVQNASDPRSSLHIPSVPFEQAQPVAASHLPAQLSASSYEMLRQCPYRFFALRMLKLRSSEELDDGVAKRDYGTWLHQVLLRFHQQRALHGPADSFTEAATVQAISTELAASHGFDDADFLPYAATFARLLPRYLSWLHQRDQAGALWLDGERALRAEPANWQGVIMVGEIDRVDSVEDEKAGPVIQLIDYKTGAALALRKKLKTPLEDTQLAFYAALMAQQSQAIGTVSAAYLALDDSEGIQVLPHPDVERSAQQLLRGVALDLQRITQGAPLRALGEGPVCDTCEARGLCRRDQWAGGA